MKPHHLEESLSNLKLFGMLDTLETRLAQASAGELGHVELLQVLCEDEAARRDATGLERRLKAARFEQTCVIEDFDFAFNEKIPGAQIRDLNTLRFVEAGESVILHGPVGVGKSMIAQALGHQACRRGYSVVFTKTSRLLADEPPWVSWRLHTLEGRMEPCQRRGSQGSRRRGATARQNASRPSGSFASCVPSSAPSRGR
ncbi:MAG: ATP-binding protein [Acidimicrobiales bacterium]